MRAMRTGVGIDILVGGWGCGRVLRYWSKSLKA